MFMDTRIFVVLISSDITKLVFTFEFEVKLYVRQIVLQRKPCAFELFFTSKVITNAWFSMKNL